MTFTAAFLLPLHSYANGPAMFSRKELFNKGAGRGDMLFLTLRLGDGERCCSPVDTGASYTLLDKSLAPKLGKRLGAKTMRTISLERQPADVYWAPPLFGDSRLLVGRTVTTVDFRQRCPYPDRPLMGDLGDGLLAALLCST